MAVLLPLLSIVIACRYLKQGGFGGGHGDLDGALVLMGLPWTLVFPSMVAAGFVGVVPGRSSRTRSSRCSCSAGSHAVRIRGRRDRDVSAQAWRAGSSGDSSTCP